MKPTNFQSLDAILGDKILNAVLREIFFEFSVKLRRQRFIMGNHKRRFVQCFNHIYAKPNLCDPKSIVKYVSRYLGQPVIALSRIDFYDGDNVTFHYNRHEDNSFVRKTLPAIDFIKLLIQHIPEKNFKMTRYYGLYAKHREIDSKLYKAIHKSKHRILLDFDTWRKRFLLTMGYDPLQCPNCKKGMLFLELYFKHERVPPEELYERSMRNHGMRPRSRSA